MQTYDKKSIAFHWVCAGLVLLLWGIGQTIDWFPKGDARVMVRSLHITVGACLGIVLFARIYWRRTGGAKLPATDQGIKGNVAIGVHHMLYALMATIVIVGFACVWFRGDSIFGLFKVPAFDPTDRELRRTAVNFHGLLANILLALASLHAGAALWHHFMLKDGVLARMWPALRTRKT